MDAKGFEDLSVKAEEISVVEAAETVSPSTGRIALFLVASNEHRWQLLYKVRTLEDTCSLL